MYLAKTTINLPVPLLQAAKLRAIEENTSVTQLIIAGLTQVVLPRGVERPSLVDFVRQLPKQAQLTNAQKDQIYRRQLVKKYGTFIP